MICPTGLQAEGLFYRDPGPPVSHSGGLLEDGVGVEVSFNRYAHRAQREGAGTVQEGVGERSFRFESALSLSYFHLWGLCVCVFVFFLKYGIKNGIEMMDE